MPTLTPPLPRPTLRQRKTTCLSKSPSNTAPPETTSLMPSVWRKSSCVSSRTSVRSRSCPRAAAPLKSRSMERKSIPNLPQASSQTRMRWSRRRARRGGSIDDLRFTIYEPPASGRPSPCQARQSQIANRKSQRRVMGAWWPPRSSKPPSACSTGRGVFDSLPLRHFDLRFAIYDLRVARRRVLQEPRKSQIVDRKSERRCSR